MRDITLEDTFYHDFTTRAFASGVPTVLAGTPALSVLEENNATPITAGVSVSVDRASVVGLNEATIVATAANGYEAGKSYSIYISTGTVSSVSVVGEVVGQFTIGASAAAVDLANGTDGLGALKTGIDDIPTVSEFNARTLVAASYFDPALDPVANVTLVATTTTNTDMVGTDNALLASSAPTNWSSMVVSGAGSVDSLVQGFLNNTIAETTADNISANFETFYDNADALTAQVVDDVGAGAGGSTDWTASERNEIRGRLGITGTTAAGGNTPTLALEATLTARTLLAASYFDPATDTVASVTTVGTTTTNTDMRGTDSALLAASAPTNFGDLAITATTGLVSVGTNNDKTGYSISGTITTLDGLKNFDPAADTVANVTLVATTTTNTDMRGTDSAATATALATVDSNVDAIKIQTDKLTFTVANQLDGNVQYVNDIQISGDGQVGTEWGPV